MDAVAVPIPDGPRDLRRRLRTFGGLAALVVPAILLAAAAVLWHVVPCDASACVVPRGAGWVAAGMAAPTGVVLGIDVSTAVVVISSAVLWLLVGVAAARLATRSPMADWSDWRRAYVPLVIAVWVGTGVGLGLGALVAA